MFVDKSGTLLGSKYKKVLYRQYDDDTFTNQTKRNEDEKHLDILGIDMPYDWFSSFSCPQPLEIVVRMEAVVNLYFERGKFL